MPFLIYCLGTSFSMCFWCLAICVIPSYVAFSMQLLAETDKKKSGEYGRYLSGYTPPDPNAGGMPLTMQAPPGYGGQSPHVVHTQPMSGHITYGQPIQGQAMYGQPVQGQAAYGQPIQGQAMYGQPVQGQPMYGQPVQGQAMYGQPVQGQPMYGQPAQEVVIGTVASAPPDPTSNAGPKDVNSPGNSSAYGPNYR